MYQYCMRVVNFDPTRLSQVRVWGRSSANTQRCAADIGGKPCSSLPEALNDADVIVTVTMATDPLVLGQWLKFGAVIICE